MSRWLGTRWGFGAGSGGGGGGGGGGTSTTDVVNEEATDLIQGAIVAQDVTTPKGLRRAIASANDNLSRPVGVTSAAILAAGSGEVVTGDGSRVEVAMVAGLAPTNGEEIVLSLTSGLGTIPGSAVSEPVNVGEVVQSVGIVIDTTPYGVDQRVLAQLQFGHRRVI